MQMSMTAGAESIQRERQPTHPGELIREELLPAMKMSQRALANILKISPQHFNRILNEDMAVTPDTALRLATFFDNDARFWLAMQDSFDLWRKNRELAVEIEEIAEARAGLAESLNLKA